MKTKNAPSIYESLCTINQSFDQILQEFARLQRDRFRGRAPIKSVELAVRETHAWAMVEILEVLREYEEGEWTRLGHLRNAQEARFNRDENQMKLTGRKRRSVPKI
jgi:hypothetical protein